MSRHVLIAYTGGTIGMTQQGNGWGPSPGFLQKFLKNMPELSASTMPSFDVVEFNPLLDSSNMSPADWIRIAGALDSRWFDGYDAFVVLHGTDTMAYTASALAMILESIDKPVVLTGSQIPLCKPRNDGRENLITALQIAGDARAPREVCIYFGDRLLRGCRTTKMDSAGFTTFDSPNLPPLASIGVNIDFHVDFQNHLFREHQLNVASDDPLESAKSSKQHPPGHSITSRFKQLQERGTGEGEGLGDFPHSELAKVGVLKLFPGFPAEWLDHIRASQLDGLVIEGFGVGNGPDRDKAFMQALESLCRKTTVLCVSQCLRGHVNLDDYVTGQAMKSAGVIGGADMTTEAALAKLFFLFQSGVSAEEAKRLIPQDLRGELTHTRVTP